MAMTTQLPAGPDTVFAAFADAAARHAQKPFLRVLPETARAYGIAAGDLGYGQAEVAIARCAKPMAGPATAMATASASCSKTGRPSSCTGSR
jgi:hypothetical protein